VSNPAVWALANGTVLFAYRSDGANDSTEHVSVASPLQTTTERGATPSRRGTLLSTLAWADFRGVEQGPAVFDTTEDPTGSEDPFLWDDERGHLHLLMHELGAGHTGLHAFSRAQGNGGWTVSATRPFSGNVSFDDGTWQVMAHRERPQLVFEPGTRRPIALSTGVRPSSVDDYSYTLVNALR
jgi:hypothetical protein